MKIAFVGPSGSGKTTLAKKVSSHFGLALISNVINSRAYLRDEQLLTFYNTARFIDAMTSIEPFVSDRWFVDNLIYARLFDLPGFYILTLRFLLEKSFDLGVRVFYVPPHNGTAPPDPQYMEKLQEELARYPQITIVKGETIEERFAFMCEELEGKS